MKWKLPILLSLLVATGSVLVAPNVLSQITPAGTQIRNRSSATYEDMSGNSFATTSNEVITVVLPVYGVSILPDDSGGTPPATPAMAQNAIPGLPVHYRYDLTNTGNENDSYTLIPLVDGANSTLAIAAANVSVYHDLNGNGIADPGEPVISSNGAAGNIGPLAGGQTVSIVVTYAVPVSALAGQFVYAGIQATSSNDGAQIDTGNYHRTDVVNDAVMTANLTGAPAMVLPGSQITYSLSGSNVGNNAANGVAVASVGLSGVLLYDVIPLDPTTGDPLPIFAAPTGIPGGGNVVYLAAGNATTGSPETWNWSLTPGTGDIALGYVTATPVAAGQSYGVSYQVTVPAWMLAGSIANTVSVAYVDNNAGTTDPTLVVSNNVLVVVGSVPDVTIGPSGNAGAGTPPDFNDDVQTVATAYAGSTVSFVNTVRNDGNASDQVNVLLDGSSTIPPTWSVLFLRADGVTPLIDNGSDGLVDVGPLAAGDSIDIVVQLVIPGTQGDGGPFDAVVRGQSTNAPGAFNVTTDRIAAVSPAAVDIGNYNSGAGTNNTGVNLNTPPGAPVDFALDVLNLTGALDTYTLSAALPAGWAVTFYSDSNGNGVLDAGEATPVSAVGPVPAFGELNAIARVTVPAGAAPAISPVSFTATSTNNATISDTIANTVTVIELATVDFSPDRNGTSTPGGSVRYVHTLANTGNVADAWDLSYVSSRGWTYVFYDAGNNPITSVTLNPGESATVIVQLLVPAGATLGTLETGTLTATGQATSVVDNVVDVTLVVAGNLELVKAVSPATDQPPGAELTYTTGYQNVGTDSVTAVVIYDAVPAFTQFKVGSAATGTPPAGVTAVSISYSADGGTTWVYIPASGAGGAPANFDANVTNVRWVMTGDLGPGDTSSVGVSFVVRIIAE